MGSLLFGRLNPAPMHYEAAQSNHVGPLSYAKMFHQRLLAGHKKAIFYLKLALESDS
jgi:hypothetical protein